MTPGRQNLLDPVQLSLMLDRLSQELIERHDRFENSVLIGLQPRGTLLARRIHRILEAKTGKQVPLGLLDVTFHRDDFRRRQGPLIPSDTRIDFSIEGKDVILIDDVLFTGRTLRSGLDALLDFGRPARVELMVLLHRLYSQEFPIRPDYFGRKVNTLPNQRIHVEWMEESERDFVWIETLPPPSTPSVG
ncbi:MAG: bifunctional pyr operon transcriptional regulator/uracil phosphoribosyltransferase PyrR [Bacteroidota bacterium]